MISDQARGFHDASLPCSEQVWRVIVRDEKPSCGHEIDIETVLLSSPAILQTRVFFVPYFNGLNYSSLQEEDVAQAD